MPVDVQVGETGEVVVAVSALSRGLDSKSSPTAIAPANSPDVQNVTTNDGFVAGLAGATLHTAGFVAPDGAAPLLLARYNPATGTAAYLAVCQNGHAYISTDNGATWTSVRRGLTASSTLWWSHCQIGDYLVIGDGTNAVYKWDGSNLLPVGAKLIADMDSGEAALWTGETVDTSALREGNASMSITSSGATVDMVYTPAANFNAVTGLLVARDYASDKAPGTDFYHFKVEFTGTGTLDTTNTRVLLTDGDTDTLNFPYTTWDSDRVGTAMPTPPLVGTFYDVYLPALGGTEGGTFDASNIDTFTFSIDTSVGTLQANFDDFYVIYAATMPASQIVAAWKNMLLGAQDSDLYFSPPGAPDEFDTVDTSVVVVDANDGTEITGLHPYGDYMLVPKDNSVHILAVAFRNLLYPDFDFTLQRVTTEHGCSSHRAMVEQAGRVYMPWRGNIYGFAGVGTVKVSEIADPTLTNLEPTRLRYIVGARLHDLNQLYWWWPPSGGNQNTLGIAYNTVQQAWLPIVGQSVALAETVYQGEVQYLLTAGYTGRVTHQNDGATWDGTSITRHYALPWVSAGRAAPVVSWREIDVPYDHQASGSLIVEARTADHPEEFDAASYATVATIDMSASTYSGVIPIHLRAPWVQFRFRTVAAQFALYWPITIRGQVLWGRP